MSRKRWSAFGALIAVAAVACGSDTGASAPLTFEEYTAEMRAIESRFQAESPDPLGDPDAREAYPVGGDLVFATETYMAFDRRLARWRGITPPQELADLHARLVGAVDAYQDEVGGYLMDEALEGSDFDFETIGPKVGAYGAAAAEACRDLQRALSAEGVIGVFSDGCQF